MEKTLRKIEKASRQETMRFVKAISKANKETLRLLRH